MSILITKLELIFIQTKQASLPKFYSTSIKTLAVSKLGYIITVSLYWWKEPKNKENHYFWQSKCQSYLVH